MKIRIKQATKQGWIEMENNTIADLSYPDSKIRRGRVQGGGNICPTLTCGGNAIHRIYRKETEKMANADDYRIRKLTARECLRLMDVSETDIDKFHEIESESQRYKAAGDSIVVNVLVAILGQMFEGHEEDYKKI